jgi:Lon protease-like protein
MPVMPMFPLGSVLLPGAVLPLHIFEPRYRALVRDCVEAADHEFGVVLIDRGSEVGGGDRRRTVGTVARLLQVAELADDQFAVVAVGTRRIRINAWLPDDPYPLADVDDWPDDETDIELLDDLYATVTGRVRRATALSVELGDVAGDPSTDLSDDVLVGSYQLSDLAPIGAADEYDLLCAIGPCERLRLLSSRLDAIDEIQHFRLMHGDGDLVDDRDDDQDADEGD